MNNLLLVKDFNLADFNSSLINYYLTQDSDISGVLTNCSKNGIITLNSKNSLYCNCFEYYTGVACQIDPRQCSQNPCLNNGTCLEDLVNSTYTCICDDTGYYGDYCQLNTDYCHNETCSYQGTCYVNPMREAECSCHSDYEGLKCEIESVKLKVIKIVTKTSSITAIIILILFYLILFIADIMDHFMRNHKFVRNKKIISRKKHKKLYYIP